MHARIVEQAELVLREAVEAPSSEVGAVEVKLLEGAEVDVLREARAVLGVIRLRRLECIGGSPGPRLRPTRPHRRGREPVAGPLPLVGDAHAVGHGGRRQLVIGRGGAVTHVGVETEHVLKPDLLELRELPPHVGADVHRPRQHALLFALAVCIVHAVASRHGDGEEVHARVHAAAEQLGALDVAQGQHAPEEQRELRVLAAELEVDVVEADDRQRKAEGGIDGDPHGQRLGAAGQPIADAALAVLLHVVPETAVGLFEHDAVAHTRFLARAGERRIVHTELREADVLLEQQVAPGDEHDLPAP